MVNCLQYDPHTDEKRRLEMAALGRMQTANPLASATI